jgi:hypothetical protein
MVMRRGAALTRLSLESAEIVMLSAEQRSALADLCQGKQ